VISLTAVRLGRLPPSLSANTASMSRVESPRASISTAKVSNSFVRPRTASPDARANGSAGQRSPAHCSRWHPPRSSPDPFGIHCDTRRPALLRGRSNRAPGGALGLPSRGSSMISRAAGRTSSGAPVRHLAAILHQRLQLVARPLGCRYSLHRGASSWRPVAKPDLVGSPDQARVHPNAQAEFLCPSACCDVVQMSSPP
jgi:hypothetical protein